MVDRTWIGGGSNSATNPKDWSPNGRPQAGDVLTMNGGTMNIVGNPLASTRTLDISGGRSSTINMVNATVSPIVAQLGTTTTINMFGVNHVDVTDGGSMTVNIAGTWDGNFLNAGPPGGAVLTVNGGVFVHSGVAAWGLDGGTAVINSRVLGVGTFDLSSFRGGVAKMEFTNAVGPGQTVAIGPGLGTEQLVIDHPKQFSGAVDVSGFGPQSRGYHIDLNNLANADSYSYQNDILSVFSHNRVIDTLRLTTNAAFSVEKTAGGISIYSGILSGAQLPAGTPLPVHTPQV